MCIKSTSHIDTENTRIDYQDFCKYPGKRVLQKWRIE
jgi:hypothetical protein